MTVGAPRFDLIGIGNAIVDVLAFTDDAFIEAHQLRKSAMMLIDEARAEALYQVMGSARECSGGSAANTLAGFASLGGKAAFIGKVKDDQLGAIFRHDLRSVGVHFDTAAAVDGPATGRCLICVTPDGERTMNTYIGACAQVLQSDIDDALVAGSAITYVEGYLWDPPAAKAAIRKALATARSHGRKIAFSLSDVFCVERHRKEFLDLVHHHLDIVFANEQELKALYETDDFELALTRIEGACDIAAITRSEKGSVIVSRQGREIIAAQPVEKVVDSTGAGDLYAAGFLYGLTQGWSLRASGELASSCASQIITQLGARSEKPLKRLIA